MNAPIRVGIVGARFAAQFHWKSYQKVYGAAVEVTGVISNTPESRKAFAREHGVRAFDSFEELCDASDVIDVCAPGSVHEKFAVAALEHGRHVIIEKPFTGYYGPGGDDFRGNEFPKETMLREAMASCDRILSAARKSKKLIGYAEDWVYAPAIQKEREIVVKSGAQILRMLGDESHSGSHSPYYGMWKFSGGGSLVGKASHPIGAVLSLKRSEGEAHGGKPIRPATVTARTHEITRLKTYRDEGFLRTDYDDVEDYSQLHITFEDGTVADLFASDLVLGGVTNWLEVYANNHRTRSNLNPLNAVETFNPREDILKDVYVVEKTSTKQGWSRPAPDEDWQHGFPQEFQDFIECFRDGREPLSNGELGSDTTAVMYSAYLSAERHGAEVEIPG
ncbi:MAG: Gfo/Idh/MocA family protein [Terriglobia bacterium]